MRCAPERGIGTLLAVFVVASVGGCSRGDSPPTRLVDGSPAGAPTVGLDAPKPQIVTKASAVLPSRVLLRSLAGRCVAESHDRPSGSAVVVRVGTTGESVSFRTASGRALVGCDGAAGGKDAARSLCGRAYARLESGRLPDPRLDLAGCVTATGDTVAFAWLAPGPHTSFVAVRQQGYVEIYPVVARVPVRISSTGNISTQRSRAMFEVSEHDASGALLHSSILEARVAG